MDWNTKWDWENLVMYNSKTIASPKKQPTSWGIVEEGEFETGSFNLSEGGCGGSSSELVHGSSVSISASTDTSPKEVLKPTMISFEAFHAVANGFSKKNDLPRADVFENSPLEASVGSGEPLIGLKLGKRTYFENHGSAGNAKVSSFSMVPVTSAVTTTKKSKSSCQSTNSARCQVEGCNLDLSSSKEYHRKHRVCESHSKSPKVIINGLERRFCQQCSRFHSLSEFDEKKKSCRRRLNDHNARRRKPQPQAHQFNPARLSASFLDGRQQMSFVLNNGSLVHSRSSVSPMWETTCSSKFTITEGSPLKSEKIDDGTAQLQVSGADMMHAFYTPGQNFNRLLPLKATKTELFTQAGLKEPMLSSSFDAAHDVHRALSLLSTDSWGSEPANVAAANNLIHMPQPLMHHRVPQGLPLISPHNWQAENNSTDLRRLSTSATTDNGGHYQEIQLFKTPAAAYNHNGVFF